MKKTIATTLSIIMIISMLFSLSGCAANDTDKFVGSWTTTINMSEEFNKEIAKSDKDMAKYVKTDNLYMTVIFTFNDDGTYSTSVDKAATKKAFKNARSDISNGIKKYLNSVLGSGNVDAYLAALGFSFDSYVDALLSDDLIDSMSKEFEEDGVWKVKKGKLFMEEKEKYFDDEDYVTYEISSDELKLLEIFGEDDEDVLAMFPMTLVKAE